MRLTPRWTFVADTVMGGVSTGRVVAVTHAGRPAARLTGDVSTDNNGGFIQMATDLGAGGAVLDASGFRAVHMEVIGNGELYHLSLRTTDLRRPWQSYRGAFVAPKDWTTVEIPFNALMPNNTNIPFNPARLRRMGILAVGRAFAADVAVGPVLLIP